jgi:hypothetical protein
VPIGRVGYRSLSALLRQELSLDEDAGTVVLMRRLRHVKRAGEFSRAEFLRMAAWKSPRARPHYRKNTAARVRATARAVLRSRSERRRLELLMELEGVSVPVASAILTLIDPQRYGVLDIRVWQLLFALGHVDGKPAGRGFTGRDWLRYLAQLRGEARRFGAPVRAVEYTLFRFHRKLQIGRLYDQPARPRTLAIDKRQRPTRMRSTP